MTVRLALASADEHLIATRTRGFQQRVILKASAALPATLGQESLETPLARVNGFHPRAAYMCPSRLRVPDKMRRRTETERFAGWPGGRNRQPRGVVDAARPRQTANKPAECSVILLGVLRHQVGKQAHQRRHAMGNQGQRHRQHAGRDQHHRPGHGLYLGFHRCKPI